LLSRLAFRTGPPGDHGLCEELTLLRGPGPGRGQVWRLSTWSTAAGMPAGIDARQFARCCGRARRSRCGSGSWAN